VSKLGETQDHKESKNLSINPADDYEENNTTSDFPDKPIVLVVEDNLELREYIAENVLSGYQVEQASTGKEGFEKALTIIPDLIISDIMMPDGNGLELCKKLKDDEKTSHIPVILLTAKQTDDNKIEGYKKGADAYISKPFNSALLNTQIENLLESRKKLRSLFSRTENKHTAGMEVSSVDKEFLKRTEQLILENLLNDEFDVERFASDFAMNRKQLSRKLKALTNQTPYEYIVMVRLKKALDLLVEGNLNISEVSYQVGFSEPTNFSRTFAKVYGKSPREYISEIIHKPNNLQ
jgi:DNA-binding response OmpR family regulator